MLETAFTKTQNTAAAKLEFRPFDSPTAETIIERAKSLINSCLHHDQVLICKDFLLRRARHSYTQELFDQHELWRISMMIEHFTQLKLQSMGQL